MGMGMGVGMGTGADADAGIYIIRLLPSPLLPSVSSSRVSDSESESAALTERSLGCSGTPVLWWLDTINSYTHRSQMVSGRMRRWPHPFAGQNGKVRLRMMPSNHWAVGIGHWAPEFKTHRRGIVQATKDDGQPHPKTKNQANKKKKNTNEPKTSQTPPPTPHLLWYGCVASFWVLGFQCFHCQVTMQWEWKRMGVGERGDGGVELELHSG